MPRFDEPLFFDAKAEYSVSTGHLPHWEQVGTVCFITFRTWDSMPRDVVQRLRLAREVWLRDHGIDPGCADWEQQLAHLDQHQQMALRQASSTRWERSLDACHGCCPFRRPELAKVVSDSLQHFDGDRYTLFDFVVMPNHVHVLASFSELGVMRRQCASWKHFTATRLNAALERKGRFWEDESFDHLVRSEIQFERLRDYIADNPKVANLHDGEFAHYSRNLPASPARVAPLAERADHPTGEHS